MQPIMTYYLATYTLQDGVHEHTTHAIFEAKTYEEAHARAVEEGEHDTETEDVDGKLFDFYDGETACTLNGIEEITMGEAYFCQSHGLAYIY